MQKYAKKIHLSNFYNSKDYWQKSKNMKRKKLGNYIEICALIIIYANTHIYFLCLDLFNIENLLYV